MSHIPADIAARIEAFNAGRLPEMLQRKYRALRKDPFRFLRGTCHLFYEDLPKDWPLRQAPPAWICGDLHLENFGSYKGDKRQVCFDINDFDEACLAPLSLDLLRLCVSVFLGMGSRGVTQPEAVALCHCLLQAYAAALTEGKARCLDKDLGKGLIGDLFASLKDRSRKDFIAARTEGRNKNRRLELDDKRHAAADGEERRKVLDFMEAFAQRQSEPDFYRVIDVARRISGTGSLGLERYAILVEGKGSPEDNYLLDLKETLPSSVAPTAGIAQPDWPGEAARVVSLENRIQAIPMAFLLDVTIGSKSFVLREVQPSEDRVDLGAWDGKLRSLESLLVSLGQLTAWGHLRGCGCQGAAGADELMAYGVTPAWIAPLVQFAADYARKVEADWTLFCASKLGT